MTTTHYVAVMNMKDGSVQVHADGCADLKRGKNFAEKWQAGEAWECIDREDIREAYNADFDEETDGWYDMTWMPCASHVPERTDYVADAIERVQAEDSVVVRKGSKRTLITVNGEEVAYVLNQYAEAAEAMVRASL
jgi:hypothetical protein